VKSGQVGMPIRIVFVTTLLPPRSNYGGPSRRASANLLSPKINTTPAPFPFCSLLFDITLPNLQYFFAS
jgi:hypothetical protein